VVTVSEKSEAYGREVEAKLMAAGLRATGDYRGIKLNAKIRDAQVQLIPYMYVVGEKNRDAGTVDIRDRLEGDLKEPFSLDAAIAKLRAEIDAKTVRQVAHRQPAVPADHHTEHEY
jgi:threonyl-tRNA synthetase